MPSINHIYWFAFYNEDSPSVRYRATFPLEYFHTVHHVRYSLIIPGYHPAKVWRFIRAYPSALLFRKKDSLIVIQRVHSSFIYSTLLKLLVRLRHNNTIYDIDDSDYLYWPSKTIYSFAKKCQYVSVGSRAIGVHLAQFNPNTVFVTSPTPDLKIIKEKRNERFTIGWIGAFGGDHKQSLMEHVFPALLALDFPAKFMLIGVINDHDEQLIRTYFKSNTALEIELPRNVDWKDERALQEQIAQFDLGVATLLENEIQLSKSGIKVKQYLNNGVPALATNLPENDWVIKEGINGYYCNTRADFKARIEEFHAMSDTEYWKFSQNARASIVDFDHAHYYNDFLQIMRRAVHKK